MPSTSRVHLLVAAGAATLLAGALAGDARADRRAFTRTYEYTTMPEGQTEIEIYSTHSRATFDGATSPQSFVLQLEVEHGITDRWTSRSITCSPSRATASAAARRWRCRR